MCTGSRPLSWLSWWTAPSVGSRWGRRCSAGAARWRSWWWGRCLVVGMTYHGNPLVAAPQSSYAHGERCVWRSRLPWSCLQSLDFLVPGCPRSCSGRKCRQIRHHHDQHAWYVGSHPVAGWSCPQRARSWSDASPESQTQGPLSLAVFQDSWWQESSLICL